MRPPGSMGSTTIIRYSRGKPFKVANTSSTSCTPPITVLTLGLRAKNSAHAVCTSTVSSVKHVHKRPVKRRTCASISLSYCTRMTQTYTQRTYDGTLYDKLLRSHTHFTYRILTQSQSQMYGNNTTTICNYC